MNTGLNGRCKTNGPMDDSVSFEGHSKKAGTELITTGKKHGNEIDQGQVGCTRTRLMYGLNSPNIADTCPY